MTKDQIETLRNSLRESPTADLIDLLWSTANEIFRRNNAGGFCAGGVFDDGRVIAVGATTGDGFPDALANLQKVIEEHKSKEPTNSN